MKPKYPRNSRCPLRHLEPESLSSDPEVESTYQGHTKHRCLSWHYIL